jgi:hypothetical protein
LDLKAMSDGEVKQATTLLRDLLRRLTTRDQGRHN